MTDPPPVPAEAVQVEALSERAMEVLGLLAERMTNKEIAREMAGSSVLGPYTSPDPAYIAEALSNATVMQEDLPDNELAIYQEARVEATDGDVGKVDELIIDPETNVISHLVLRQGHFWGKRDITIPVDQVDRVEDDIVYLRLDKKAIEQLPSVQARKK